jgi:hypothetical protein
LPNIKGTTTNTIFRWFDSFSGALKIRAKQNRSSLATADQSHDVAGLEFDASKGETKTDGTLKDASEHHVYGASDTVQPDSVCVNYIIKY